VCYIDAEMPELEKRAGSKGFLSILLGSENHYDVYGSGLFTSSDMTQRIVQRFVNAYLKAFGYVIKNPEEAAKIVAASAPELRDKKDVFREQLQADIDHTFTSDATDARGLGAMDRAVWQSIVDVLTTQKVIEHLRRRTLFDTRFVEKAAQALPAGG